MCVWHNHHLLQLMFLWGQNMNLPNTVFEYFIQTYGERKKGLLAFHLARTVVESYVRNVIGWDGVEASGYQKKMYLRALNQCLHVREFM